MKKISLMLFLRKNRKKSYSVFGVFIIGVMAIFFAGSVSAAAEVNVRKPAVSGQFYPGFAPALHNEVRDFLEKAVSKPDPDVRALIVPHAGYTYSGQIAADAYKTVEGQSFDTVIIIGFTHRVPFQGVYVDDHDAYETPLGRVPVNLEMVKAIRSYHPVLQDAPRGRFDEHSVEVQVPFLQETLKNLSIVPVYMGDQTLDHAKILSEAIAKVIRGKKVLVVVSTDLSHYHPYEEASKKDKALCAIVEEANPLKFAMASDTGKVEACGSGPVMTLLMLQADIGWTKPTLIRYANSGDVTGDRGRVVGYAAMALRVPSAPVENKTKS
jgi:AmmeMemoRadiSam system protein B